jgi:DNA-binding CsgD family transcriptional regulator
MRETVNRRQGRPHWSERQKEVLDLIADGCTNAEIGERLGITFATAKWHVSELITELGVDSREDVAAYWRSERGLRGRLRRVVGAVAGLGLWKVAAGAVVAAGVVGIVAAVVVLRPSPHAAAGIVSPTGTATVTSPTSTSSITTTPQPTTSGGLTTSRLPSSACSPLNGEDPRAPMPVDLSFIDGLHGWVLAGGNSVPGTNPNQQTCDWIGRTDDGGKTWVALPGPDIPLDDADSGAGRIVFTGASTGWLWGPALYVTQDGGTTWTAEHVSTGQPDGQIASFAATGAAAWAVEGTIQGVNGSDAAGCPCTLQRTTDLGAHWTALAAAPLNGASAVQVAALSADDAWVAVTIPTMVTPTTGMAASALATLKIFVTHDEGAHWTQVSAPPAIAILGGQLVVSSLTTLWWVQWGEPATDMSSKWIYRSDDGGAHWELIADEVLGDHPNQGQFHNLPGVGDGPVLTVVTPSLLFLWMDRAPPYVSRDGGATWTPAISEQATEADAMGFVGPTVFGDATHGAVAEFGLGLIFVTDDAGRTWTLVHLPRT